MSKPILVTCETEHALDFRLLRDFQGDLKTRDEADAARLKRSILEHGITFPCYVWKHVENDAIVYDTIDGHGRLAIFRELESEGHVIPPVPVVFIEITDANDARERLIQVNTLAGQYTETGLQDLILSAPDVDLSQYVIPGIDTAALSEHIGQLRETLAFIDGVRLDVEESTVIAEPVKAAPKTPQTQEIVIQCKGCGKSFTHIAVAQL